MRSTVMMLAGAGLVGALGVSDEGKMSSGMPFEHPHAIYSSGGSLYVEFDYTTCDYVGPLTSFTTRCYAYEGEPMLPGPTLYVKPGDQLTIKLTNRLSDADEIGYHNFWQYINSTNLHFHGGHVSANKPGDDVLTMIKPMQADCLSDDCPANSITYVYEIPEYHSPGTAWYHPHGHGSATLQTGTGSSGFIIIQDEHEVPSYISDAPDILVNMNHYNLAEIVNWGAQTCLNSNIFVPTPCGSEGCYPTSSATGESGILLINGQTDPVITMTAGKWYRHRYLMASTLFMTHGAAIGDEATVAGCRYGLLAKDSIYITTPLRPITGLYMYPGTRADVMIKCDVPGSMGLASAYFENQEMVAKHVLNYVGPMFRMEIVEGESPIEPMLPKFRPQRPCYLADTTGLVGNTDWVVQKPLVYDHCETGRRRLSGSIHLAMDTAESRAELAAFAEENKEHRQLAQEEHRQLAGGDYAIDPDTGVYTWTYGTYPGYSGYGDLGGMLPNESCESLADFVFAAKSGSYCVNGCSFEVGTRYPVESGITNLTDNTEFQAQVGKACKVVNNDAYLEVGTIMEWDVWGIDYHPVHFHVNPYQLVKMHYGDGSQAAPDQVYSYEQFTAFTGSFFDVGDFGDSMMLPIMHVTLHQQLDNFNSVMVMHCHILLHEDIGMMAAFAIQGEEGTHTRIQEYDPTCYWTNEEKTGYEIIDDCSSDAECPTGWHCPTESNAVAGGWSDARRRSLKFGAHVMTVCEED